VHLLRSHDCIGWKTTVYEGAMPRGGGGDVTAGAGLVFESAAPITQGETSLESLPVVSRSSNVGWTVPMRTLETTRRTRYVRVIKSRHSPVTFFLLFGSRTIVVKIRVNDVSRQTTIGKSRITWWYVTYRHQYKHSRFTSWFHVCIMLICRTLHLMIKYVTFNQQRIFAFDANIK